MSPAISSDNPMGYAKCNALHGRIGIVCILTIQGAIILGQAEHRMQLTAALVGSIVLAGSNTAASRGYCTSTTAPGALRHLMSLEIPLFCGAIVRLVETELTDLSRLDVFHGPAGRCFPMVKIQRAAGSIA